MNLHAEHDIPSSKHSTTGRGLRWFSFLLLVGACVFLTYAIWDRSHQDDQLPRSPNYPPAGLLPESFPADQSPEAEAFRITCNKCHNWPSPRLHDRKGWLGVKRLMSAQIAERRMSIPQPQINLAIDYAIQHARAPRKPFRSKSSAGTPKRTHSGH